MVVMDPTGWLRFFVGAAKDLVGRPCFGVIVGLAVGLGGEDGLAIGGAVSTRKKVAVGFSRLSL